MSKKVVEVRFKLRNLDQINAHNLFIESNKAKYNSINELLTIHYVSSIQKQNLENNIDLVQNIVREEILKATKLLLKADKNYTDDLMSLLLQQQIVTNYRTRYMFNILAKQLGVDLNLLNNPGENSELLNEIDCIKEFEEQLKTDYDVWKDLRRKEREGIK
ncbi:hypothetical protein [Spiroplasma sp. SV19]|uniref:hypothetical protein n=1 Tax=Spiroplasma sp. SV19 TaxID=2570468 RepID=UPI0024B79354|nr:hypothetical protein [Spiroplasma sp. SV19]WHQ37072.1 hypothetical protein E7Y35_04140 [Spiroplasma sp. SV19]